MSWSVYKFLVLVRISCTSTFGFTEDGWITENISSSWADWFEMTEVAQISYCISVDLQIYWVLYILKCIFIEYFEPLWYRLNTLNATVHLLTMSVSLCLRSVCDLMATADLNPIEHLWDVVKWEICIMDGQLINLQELCDANFSTWRKISKEKFKHPVEYIPWRRKSALKTKGCPPWHLPRCGVKWPVSARQHCLCLKVLWEDWISVLQDTDKIYTLNLHLCLGILSHFQPAAMWTLTQKKKIICWTLTLVFLISKPLNYFSAWLYLWNSSWLM